MYLIVMFGDINLINRPDRATGLAMGGAKAGEIVFTDQQLRRVMHGGHVQILTKMPYPSG